MNDEYDVLSETERVTRLTGLLKEMLQVLIQRWPQAQFDYRQTLILAHIHRAIEQADLCSRLAHGLDAEHIWLVYRPLGELVINAGYLQFAEPLELDRFIHHDWQRMVAQQRKLLRHRPPDQPIPQEVSGPVDALASEAAQQTKWTDAQTTWSKYDLSQRSKTTDSEYTTKGFHTLYLAATPLGNAAAHSTMAAFNWSANVVGGTSDDADVIELRRRLTASAMHIVVLCLSLLCYSIDEKQSLAMKSRISRAES